MRFARLGGVEVFLTVAKTRHFGEAAKLLGLSPSAVSAAVRNLEEQLGLALLARTTRSVALTEAGQLFFEAASSSFALLENAFTAARQQAGTPVGRLRINLPALVFQPVIAPRLASFVEKYPRIELECVCDDTLADIVEQGFDAGVRPRETVAKDMLAVRLHPPVRYLVAAAPAYYQRHGVPKRPEELIDHNCIVMRFGRGARYDEWEFSARRREYKVKVSGSLIVNDFAAQTAAAVGAGGLIYQAEHVIAAELSRAELAPCLEAHQVTSDGYFLYFPKHARNEPKLRAFVDHFSHAQRAR
jgi:DNA-binding transcriptional LysR family regulator